MIFEGGSSTVKVHLIGIAGEGMTGLAQCLLDLGHTVSGSDTKPLAELKIFKELGVVATSGHRPENISGIDIVIHSDAISPWNVELAEARILNIPILSRAQSIKQLLHPGMAILVSGSHGKSTTAAMIATALKAMNADPSFLIGAEAPSLDLRRGRIGRGPYFVAEACEAYQNLIHYEPTIAVITNIDDEHIEQYGSQSRLEKAFIQFANRAQNGVVVCCDDPGTQRIIKKIQNRVMTFGISGDSDIRAEKMITTHEGTSFDLYYQQEYIQSIFVALPGIHIVRNALASIASLKMAGLSLQDIGMGISQYLGANRRWQQYQAGTKVTIIDDYAHHPTELCSIRLAARSIMRSSERLVVAFQPQLFSRTKRLAKEFARELSQFDEIILLEIDGGNETNIENISSEMIAHELHRMGISVTVFSSTQEFIACARNLIKQDDFVCIAGAGSISGAAKKIASYFCQLGDAFISTKSSESANSNIDSITPIDFKSPIPDSYPGVLKLFYHQIALQPQLIAVSQSNRALTYYQLNRVANQIASFLSSHGIGIGDAVAIQANLSLEMMALMVAIQKLGAIYVPLDVRLPEKRSFYQMKVSHTKLWISSIPPLAGTPGNAPHISMDDVREQLYQSLDNHAALKEIHGAISEQDPAYICFTSGSTGTPKGVTISHQSLTNFAAYTSNYFHINALSKVLANTSISFDVSVGEIWMTLAGGGQLILTESQAPLIGSALSQLLKKKQITHFCVTPTVLASVPAGQYPNLNCIVCAGEPLSQSLVTLWAPNRMLFNAYGPTESTIYASISRCHPDALVSLGTPLANVFFKVVDAQLRPIQTEGIGELCIGGMGLMNGYLNTNPEQSFLFLPTESGTTEKLYRTGDIVKIHADGSLEYLHRLDSQIKINGLRIELEEVEQVLAQEDEILDAVVCLDQSQSHPLLLAFVILKNQHVLDWRAFKEDLSKLLPAQMIPNQFVPVKSIPFTLAGKKDRKLILSDFKRKKILQKNYSSPRNSIEAQLAQLLKKILHSEFEISVIEDFQSLGGDSIALLELIEQIESSFKIEIPPGHLGNLITIELLAIKIADLLWTAKPTQELDATEFTGSRVYKGLRDLTAQWKGDRMSSLATIVTSGLDTANYDLFVCVQNQNEFEFIAKALGDNFRIHALRSGHLLIDNSHAAIFQIANHYANEIQEIQPRGKLLLAGICQGGSIALEIANILTKADYCIELLVLIDQARLISYEKKIAFIYSAKGALNPYKRFTNGLSKYDSLYGQNYSVNIISCEHGMISLPPYVNELADILRFLLSEQDNDPHLLRSIYPLSNSEQVQQLEHTAKLNHGLTFANAYQQWHHEKSLVNDQDLIATHYLFDAQHYISQLNEPSLGLDDAIGHFINYGWKVDFNPGPLFSTLGYQQRNPSPPSEDLNPLCHYLHTGMYLGILPWSSEDLLKWQGEIHQDAQLALNAIAACPLPWIKFTDQNKVYLHAHSQGHFVFHQFQELISQSLNSIGIQNERVDERRPLDMSDHAMHIVIGPHDFFFLPGAKDPREFNFEQVIILNSEQMNSHWFAKIIPILEKSKFILDMNLQNAASLVRLGFNARFLPLGYTPKNELFQAPFAAVEGRSYRLDVSEKDSQDATSYFSVQRNIDLLWIGSNSSRRNRFLTQNRDFFQSTQSKVLLIKNQGPLNRSHAEAILPQEFLRLAHRSKILLNVHHFDAPYFEWQRLMHYGFMQGCCVVTETCSRIPGLIPNTHYFEADIDQLPALLSWLINHPDGQAQLEQVRRAGYEAAMTQFNLDQSLRELFDIPTQQGIDAKAEKSIGVS